ncbi:AraC family transcriptional regulator [Paenibacillus sp. CN-4]|uniref:AraC family transcriptional regulator n=1 Tax=Paenibacillus nanchangensis TaxID=3348343 RepID=UPI00397937F5
MMNQVICETRSYTNEFTLHEHEYAQFLFPLKGSLDLQTEWQEVQLNPDYCFYLPPGSVHNFRSVGSNEFLILDIPTRFLPENTTDMYIRLDQQWASIRYLLEEEATNQGNLPSLEHLTRYVANKLQTSLPPSVEYIHHHFKEPIRLETLAQIEHYHPIYYSAWFKRKTGKSPKVYIAELRLKEAKHLLRSTEWSMSAISEELRFENSSSFTRWFVNWEGISPHKYRILNMR